MNSRQPAYRSDQHYDDCCVIDDETIVSGANWIILNPSVLAFVITCLIIVIIINKRF